MRARLRQLVSRVVLNQLIASSLVGRTLRWRLLRACGLDVERCEIEAQMFCGGTDIAIGAGCFVNVRALLDNSARITIGPNAYLGPNVTIVTSTHAVGPTGRRAGDLVAAPVVIGAGAWLGAGVTVLPGVTIGAGCVIAAGSVVTADCAPDGLYAGAPAVRKRSLG